VTELLRTDDGAISISPAALSRLAVQAAEQVDGARVRRRRRSVRVQVEADRARVTLELSVRHGAVLPELTRSVQERVTEGLRTMLEVEVDAVEVSVEEVHD
jgi:uncharacterized alkaline shock family protein YloU